MPPAVMDRYEKYIENKDFPNKDVQSWHDDLMKDNSTEWKDLPKISDLSDNELDLLYKDLLQTFSAMNGHRGSLSNESKTFVETYYGPEKLFSIPDISPDIERQIKQLLTRINDGGIVVGLEWPEPEIIEEVLNGTRTVNNSSAKKSIDKIVNRLMDNDKDAINELENLGIDLIKIRNAVNTTVNITDDIREKFRADCPQIFGQLFKEKKIYDDFKKYEPDEKIVSEQIDSALSKTDYTGKINESNYVPPKYKDTDPNIRQRINKGLKNAYSDVLKKFLTVHRANLFMKPTSKAIIEKFDDKDIQIKPTDDLNVLIAKSDAIAGKLRGKEPFKAADHLKWLTGKLKVYKENGLSDSIDGALRWGYQMNRIVTELITEAAKEGKVEEAKTALEVLSVMQYGTFTSRTMDAINQTDFTIFSDKNLSWMKNGKEPMGQAVQFVAGAADFLIKKGVQAVGYAATAVVNHARKRGATFDNKGPLKTLSDKRKEELAKNKAEAERKKNEANATDNAKIQDNDAIINGATKHLSDTYNGMTVEQAQKEIKNHETEMQQQVALAREAQERMEGLQSKHDEYEQNNEIVTNYDNIPQNVNTAKSELRKIKREIKKRQSILASKSNGKTYSVNNTQSAAKTKSKQANNFGGWEISTTFPAKTVEYSSGTEQPTYKSPITKQPMSEKESEHYEEKILNEISELEKQYDEKKAQIKQLNDTFNNKDEKDKRDKAASEMTRLDKDNKAYLTAEQDLDTAKRTHHTLETDKKYLDLQENVSKYSDAVANKEKAQKDIDLREKEWGKWDEKNKDDYEELMAYWDFLQSGKTKSMFHISTKKLQAEMDKVHEKDDEYKGKTEMQIKYAKWKKAHSYGS